MKRHLRIPSAVVTLMASLIVVCGLLVSDASAHGRHQKKKAYHSHSHRSHPTKVVVRRPVVVHPRVSFAHYRPAACPAPTWCRDASYVVYDGDPYWHHVGLGVYFGGVNLNVDVNSAPPSGCGYWDPYCEEWFDDARAYSSHCGRYDHAPTLQIVQYDDECSDGRW